MHQLTSPTDSLKLLLEKANAARTTNPKSNHANNVVNFVQCNRLLLDIVVLFPISARMLCFLMDYPTALKMLTSLNTLRSLRMGKYQLKKKIEKKKAELKKALQNLICPWFLFRYSQSKWVAEQLVLRARTQGLPVVIYRLGTKRDSNYF